MGVVRFCVCAVFLSIISRGSYGLYENNPFLSKVVVPLQNVILNSTQVLPPGVHPNNTHHPGTTIINIPSYVSPAVITQLPASPIQTKKPADPQPKLDDYVRNNCLKPRGQFPSSKCNKFVNCWDEIALEQFCPVGLAFNPAGFCDYAYNVDCRGKSFEALPAPEIPPSSGSPDIIAHPEKNPSVQPPQYTTASPPYRPPVDTSPPIYIPIGSVPDENLKKRCVGPRGLFPSKYCNKYVNCWDGFAVEQDCPPGLSFSDKGYCDYDYNVNCHGRIILDAIQSVLQQNVGEPSQLEPHQTPTFMEPAKQTTLPPNHLFTGVTPSTPSPVTQQPGSPTVPYVPPVSVTVDENLKRKCAGLRGQFPSDSCHKYIDCWDQFAFERDCPPGLLFSEKGYCDFAHNVNCLNRTVTKTSPDPSCPTPNGTFRDKSNCSRYYTCIENTVAVKNECPAGLHFNDVIGVCDYAYRVDCSREPFIYQPILKSDLIDATAGCTPGQVFRLNAECSSAALCRNSVIEVIHCPAGLAYDAPSDRCLPLQLARCQNA